MNGAGVQIDVDRADDVVVARLAGEIDASNATLTADRLLSEATSDAVGLVLDLGGVRYLDSSGVSMLFAMLRRLETSRQRLVLAVPEDSPLRRLFAVTRVDKLVTVRVDVRQAIKDLDESSA